MTEELKRAIEEIEKQQPKKRDAVWCVGEQLKDILRREPQWAGMVAEDIKNESQSLQAVEKLIEKRANENKVGNCGFVSPMEAEKIIRKVYCIPEAGEERGAQAHEEKKTMVALEDFF